MTPSLMALSSARDVSKIELVDGRNVPAATGGIVPMREPQ